MPLDDAAAVVDLDRGAARANADPRRQPDERVAAEPLAADDRLEQERERLVGELDVERQRRVEVGERFEDERNAVVALRGKRAEFGFGHGASDDLFKAGSGAVAGLRGASLGRATPRTAGRQRQRQAADVRRQRAVAAAAWCSKKSKLISAPLALRAFPRRPERRSLLCGSNVANAIGDRIH